MEKESSREKKRDSAKKSKDYSCYSSKSIRIKEENKNKSTSNSKNGSGAQAHMHHGETGRASPRDSAVGKIRSSFEKTRRQSYNTFNDSEHGQ